MHEWGVLWDLDGTLVDSEPLHEETLVMSLETEGIAPPPDLHELVVGMPAKLIHETFRERYGLAKTLSAVKNIRGVRKHHMVHNAYTPTMEIDHQTYAVRADGQLLVCDPAVSLPMTQRYFLF